MNNANYKAVAEGAMRIVDRMQDMRPAHSVLAAAAVFMMLCKHYGVRPTLATTAAANMVNTENERSVPFRAVRAFIQNELPVR